MKKTDALRYRGMIQKAAVSLPDDDAVYVPAMFPAWTVGTPYETGQRIQHSGVLYKVLQPHTSQADWTPDVAVSLFVAVPFPGTIPEWVQPAGAQDAYQAGDKVKHNGKTWVSTVDNNVWEPGVYGWDEA